MDHCGHCPVDPAKRPCRAVTSGITRFCELVDPNGEARQDYVRKLRGEPEPEFYFPALLPMPMLARADKPRGSLADAARAKRDCIPCRAKKLPVDAERILARAVVKPYESLTWLRRWAAQGADPVADVRRYTAPPEVYSQAVPVYGWLHVAVMGSWEPILREQLSAIERSGLLTATSRVYAGIVGPPVDLSWLPKWLTVVKRDGPIDMGECSTLQALWDWSKTAPQGKVWYVHTKGASRGENAHITAWRDYLTYFTILRWREAAAVLDGPYDICGCDYTVRDNEWFKGVGNSVDPAFSKGAGFEGNFWWARSEYLLRLAAEGVNLNQTRWGAEWSFVGAGNPRAYELHGPHMNLYREFYPRAKYDPAPVDDRLVVDCGDGVFLTKASSCATAVGRFPLSIHIWKSEDLRDESPSGRTCDRVRTGSGAGILVEYREGAMISSMSPDLGTVMKYMASPDSILIHCVAGHYRGPVLAAIAKVARGCDPARAIEQVERANRELRGLPKPIDPLNQVEILALARATGTTSVAH